MKRRFIIVGIFVGLLVVAVFAIVNTHSVRISYHQWCMNSAYNTLFGDPQPAGNGLASHDVTGIDVDAVMAKYEAHRQKLVDLKVLAHLQANFANLISDGTEQQSDARSAFVHRMWNRFPEHKHYYLAGSGSFETWVPVETANNWNNFIGSEVARSKSHPDNTDQGN